MVGGGPDPSYGRRSGEADPRLSGDACCVTALVGYLLCGYGSAWEATSMRVPVQKWGNSLALRIPKPFAEDVGVSEGTVVDVSISKGRLIAAPVGRRRARLEDLLRRVTKRNLHGEVGTGPAVGREAW
jgi:antitoxin MazE